MNSLSLKYIASIIFLLLLISACDQQDAGQFTAKNLLAAEHPPDAVQSLNILEPVSESVWVSGWREGPLMQIPRSGSASIEVDGVIHVIGGVDGNNFQRSSEYIRVAADGSLSAWQLGPELNRERGFFSAVRHKEYVYVVGGGQGSFGKVLLNSVERAEILSDGTLGSWTEEVFKLNTKRRCSKLAVIGNHIYAFGGFSGILLDTVERVEVLSDGSLGEWEVLMENMKQARYIHGVTAVAEQVYVVGGHDKEKGLGISAVEWSHEDSEGWLESWQSLEPLQTGRYGLATVQNAGYLYALGGLDGAAYLDSVEKAQIEADGTLSAWTFSTPLPSRREGANALLVEGNIYLIGGTNLDGYKRSIEYAGFNDQGDIGYWASPIEAEKEKAKFVQRQAQERVLPNEAVITINIKAEQYNYLAVKRDDGLSAWLASPATDLVVGERVRFPNGVVMRGFYSKELKREFPVIMFVGEVRRVQAHQETVRE